MLWAIQLALVEASSRITLEAYLLKPVSILRSLGDWPPC